MPNQWKLGILTCVLLGVLGLFLFSNNVTGAAKQKLDRRLL